MPRMDSGAQTDGPAEMWVSPEPAVGVFNASRNPARALSAHYVIGCADPCQNPAVVRFGGSRVRGRDLDRVRSRRRGDLGDREQDQGAGSNSSSQRLPAATGGSA